MSGASGETDLDKLLSGLAPLLHDQDYVFCTVPADAVPDLASLALATYQEQDGTTLVLEQSAADAEELDYGAVLRCITLQVHSSLEAVGLTAAVAGALAEAGISANVIAAYYHDHVFVPADRAEDALAILRNLAG